MVTIWIDIVGALTEWNCSTTTGVFTRSTDCTISNEIVVTSKLNITGIPDAQGNLPKLTGGGSNRLFKVKSGGVLVVNSLNLISKENVNVTLKSTDNMDLSTSSYLEFEGSVKVANYTDIFITGVEMCGRAFRGGNPADASIRRVSTDASKWLFYFIDGPYFKMILAEIKIFEERNQIGIKAIGAGYKGYGNDVTKVEQYWSTRSSYTYAESCGDGGYGATNINIIALGTVPVVDGFSEDSYLINVLLSPHSFMSKFPKNCSTTPTLCQGNGYTNAICTNRQNRNEGIICTKNIPWKKCNVGFKQLQINPQVVGVIHPIT
eukprot:g1551.t1